MVAPQPQISVIIPAYNAARWLKKAIESALNQTFKPSEIIVVDDGSTDETPRILKEYQTSAEGAPSLKVFRQENLGVSRARNSAMKRAKGEWFAFLDADDRWDERKLAVVVDWMAKKPETQLFYHDSYVVDECDEVAGIYTGKSISRLNAARELLMKNVIATSTVVLKREVFRDIDGFRADLKRSAGCEDWDYWIRASVNHLLTHIPVPLSYYRRVSGSATRTGLDELRDDAMKIIEEMGRKLGMGEEEIKRCKASAHRESAVRKLAAFDSAGAREDLAQARHLAGRSARDMAMWAASYMPRSLQQTMLKLKRKRDVAKAVERQRKTAFK